MSSAETVMCVLIKLEQISRERLHLKGHGGEQGAWQRKSWRQVQRESELTPASKDRAVEVGLAHLVKQSRHLKHRTLYVGDYIIVLAKKFIQFFLLNGSSSA